MERAPRVLEIGAGTGILTHALVDAGAQVTAIEIDPRLVAILGKRDDLRGAAIVCADALAFDYAAFAREGRWHAAGNLPYYIATALVVRLIEMHDGPASLTVMVQRDVAERLVATPGSAAYGSLSVAVRYQMQAEIALVVGPHAFHPVPKIESAVVRMRRLRAPAVQPRDVARFRQVVRAAFAYRRKTLANSLALALHVERRSVEDALRSAGISTEQRGERLDLADFARLADALAEG
jgi:16S rRNA (adenine1518-N6/adenine1519-N6)-dimethyltransferase